MFEVPPLQNPIPDEDEDDGDIPLLADGTRHKAGRLKTKPLRTSLLDYDETDGDIVEAGSFEASPILTSARDEDETNKDILVVDGVGPYKGRIELPPLQTHVRDCDKMHGDF